MPKGMPPGIAKRHGVSRETVREMREKGLSDAAIEAKLAAGKDKREALKAKAAEAKGQAAPEAPAPASKVRTKSGLQRILERGEAAKAQRQIMVTKRMAEGLVDAGQVFSAQQRQAAKVRDGLMALPARVAGPVAARLGCNEVLLRDELRKIVRTFLAEHELDATSAAA
jgi:hypothetical protein